MGFAVFAVLWQAAVETYAAVAADIPFAIQIAQAILPLFRCILFRCIMEYIEK
ncbi:MAG: hypothetical protein LBS96_00065 [Oscillospiraceae bacterium]|jgi:hypothetical protein|nr:hypothetical protein [Oscillospiraceae bacterium]